MKASLKFDTVASQSKDPTCACSRIHCNERGSNVMLLVKEQAYNTKNRDRGSFKSFPFQLYVPKIGHPKDENEHPLRLHQLVRTLLDQ